MCSRSSVLMFFRFEPRVEDVSYVIERVSCLCADSLMSFFQLHGILQWILSVRSLQVASLRPSPQSPSSGTHFPNWVSAVEHSDAGLVLSCFPPAGEEESLSNSCFSLRPSTETSHDTFILKDQTLCSESYFVSVSSLLDVLQSSSKLISE